MWENYSTSFWWLPCYKEPERGMSSNLAGKTVWDKGLIQKGCKKKPPLIVVHKGGKRGSLSVQLSSISCFPLFKDHSLRIDFFILWLHRLAPGVCSGSQISCPIMWCFIQLWKMRMAQNRGWWWDLRPLRPTTSPWAPNTRNELLQKGESWKNLWKCIGLCPTQSFSREKL